MPNQSPLEFDLDDHLAAARELAANTSPQALLTAFANLTHRLHASEDDQHSADLRTQRGIVEAELLRRMALFTITDAQLNRAAQAAYDTKLVHIPAMTDKPRVVSMVRDVLLAVGVPTSALPPEQASSPRDPHRDAPAPGA